MAKAQQEGLAAGAEGPTGPTPHEQEVDRADLMIKKQLADAKVMDTKIKAAQLQAGMEKDRFDNAVEEQEMLAKERIQMIDLAQNLAVHPESEQIVRNLLGNVIPAITGKRPQ
jgi:hypothetical protein